MYSTYQCTQIPQGNGGGKAVKRRGFHGKIHPLSEMFDLITNASPKQVAGEYSHSHLSSLLAPEGHSREMTLGGLER